MIENDIEVIENDIVKVGIVQRYPFVRFQSVLRERGIKVAGFEIYQSFQLKWARRRWHLGLWITDGSLRVAHESGTFDVSTGEFALNPELKVACYPTSIEGDSVMVEL